MVQGTEKMKVNKARSVLHSAGQKVTPQRMALLDLIRAEGHFDADEIYRKARKKYPRISLSTVYRSLQLFRGLGLVEGHSFDESHHHYETKARGEHYHLLCHRCGSIVEFAHPLIEEMKKEVSKEYKFTVEGADIHLTGTCPDCRNQTLEGNLISAES